MKKSVMLALLPLLLVLPMCGGDNKDGAAGPTVPSATGTSPTGTPTTGTATSEAGDVRRNLRVFLTDKPAVEYSEVWVTISSVRVHRSGDAGELDGEWMEIPVTADMPVDLLVLRGGVLLGLGSAPLPVGHYQQIRLVLAQDPGANYVVIPDGTPEGIQQPIEVPSGTIKIVHPFTLEAAEGTDLTLDFDASQSVRKRGNGGYFMQPVIKASSSTAG
jgi:hypothetical protein